MTFGPGIPLKRRTLVAAIVLSVLVLMAYADFFDTPFIYDDVNNIVANAHIRMTALDSDHITAVFNSPSANRPVANLTMALNYYFHRYDVFGYHLVNLLVHLSTGLLMFLAGRLTLRLCGREDILAPFLAAALWLVNPVHTQSVTYTVQRMNSLAAMFFMLALCCYILARLNGRAGRGRARRLLLYGACLAAAVLGLGAKEIAVTLPVVLFLYEWYFFQNLDRAWLKKQLPWIGLLMAAILLLAGLYLGTDPMGKILKAYEKQNFTPGQRLLTEPAVVVYYLSLLFFPHPGRLTLIYDFPVFSSILSPPAALLAVLALAALAIAGLRLAEKQRLLSFAIFWFLINLLLESSFYGLTLVFEHRTYLPSIFPFIALTALLINPSRTRRTAPVAILLGLVVLAAVWTYQRNAVWGDVTRFWQDNVAKTPQVPEVHNNLGQALLKADRNRKAAACFMTAVKLDPGMEAARVNLGVALDRLGKPDLSMEQYRTVLAMNPGNIDAGFNLAMQLKKQGEVGAAISRLKKIAVLEPDNTGIMLNLGIALMELWQSEQALAWFQKAASLDTGDTRILNNMGIVLHRLGKTDKAWDVLQRGLALEPDNPRLHNSIGLILVDRGQYQQAGRHFRQALAADPQMAEAYNNLGLTAERQGHIEQAVDYYGQALQHAPAYDLARYNLASALLKSGRPGQAVDLLNKRSLVKNEYRLVLDRLVKALADAGELTAATALLEKMKAAMPDNAAVFYNLACLYARQNDRDRAVGNLKKAVERGYDNWHHLKVDPDLQNIKDSVFFKKIINDHGR